MTTIAQRLASLVTARENCIVSCNNWRTNHENNIRALVREYLPHGSGFDAGAELMLEPEKLVGYRSPQASNSEKLVFVTSFHHMDEHGAYDGWSDMTIVVTPSFSGINVTVRGKDRDGIHEYAAEVFRDALMQIERPKQEPSASATRA